MLSHLPKLHDLLQHVEQAELLSCPSLRKESLTSIVAECISSSLESYGCVAEIASASDVGASSSAESPIHAVGIEIGKGG